MPEQQLRRQVTGSGLLRAFFVVLGAMGLGTAIVGIVIGPRTALTDSITLGALSLLALGSYAYRYVREARSAPEKPTMAETRGGARLTNAQFRAVEALWAAILVAAVVAIVVASGPKRAAFGVPAAFAIAALVVLELRRQSARGSE